jgi:thymidine phosphorylase
MDLSVELAAEMVVLGGRAGSLEQARETCRRTVADGSALECFRALVQAQGGDPRVIDDPSLLPAAKRQVVVRSPVDGFVRALAARPVGEATMLLGAGRARTESTVDHAVGVLLHKKARDTVARDEALCTLLVNDEQRLHDAETLIREAYSFAEEPAAAPPLFLERIAPAGLPPPPIRPKS